MSDELAFSADRQLSSEKLEAMANTLRASGDYRVQRRLLPRTVVTDADGTPTRLGLFVDVETTGLDPTSDEIIELAIVPFTYALDGRIFAVHDAFQRFRQPAEPISEAITRLTGITNEMVAGHTIDSQEVSNFASDASLVIAHNAAFDRRFLEHLSDVFATKPWACSMTQVDWVDEGHEGTKLVYLAVGAGFFYERHRAAEDCRAAIELLASRLPRSGEFAMARLLQRARRSNWRIWATGAPYDSKDVLKARGYRWNGDANPNPRAWYIDVEDRDRESEISFLHTKIYLHDVDLKVHEVTAYNRYSDRA